MLDGLGNGHLLKRTPRTGITRVEAEYVIFRASLPVINYDVTTVNLLVPYITVRAIEAHLQRYDVTVVIKGYWIRELYLLCAEYHDHWESLSLWGISR